jgi:hypothetical protein
MSNFVCPPQRPSGAGTFSDNLVGLQLVQGGGLTFANFTFSTTFSDKSNRNFYTGDFSGPQTLESLNISSVAAASQINQVNFKIYPNFDEENVLNFVAYGSLSKRFSSAILNVVNHFPASFDVNSFRPSFTTGITAYNVYYNSEEDFTTFSVDVENIRNPFRVDFSTDSERYIKSLDFEVSKYRDFTKYFQSYVLNISGESFGVLYMTASTSVSAGTLTLSVNGYPFDGYDTINNVFYGDYIIRPNDFVVSEVFNLELDEVEELLLNRYTYPIYSASFKVLSEASDGTQFEKLQKITWPLDGIWNVDISGLPFLNYITKIQEVAGSFDEVRTDLLSRFYTTDSLREFDTIDQKFTKVLRIYGRSFDESKKYIDSLSHMVSVNYTVGNDIPSKLLPNLAETLGWNTNISPIQTNSFLSTIYQNINSEFAGQANSPTIDELEFQYYRNLILNSAFLFKSKGTRKSIEFLMKFIGAPEALVEFNENVYLADNKIPTSKFDGLYSTIAGGTFSPEVPILDPNNIYRFNSAPYTAYTSSTTVLDVSLTRSDFPVDSEGYPRMPISNDSFYFQKGAGWFESTPQHTSPEIINLSTSVFTGESVNIQTELEPFTYGEKYLSVLENFPYLGIGFGLEKTIDNRKSWTIGDVGLRKNNDATFDAYYNVSDDRLVVNVKNIDLFLNPGQALTYDVWYLSNTKNYPIPSTGLSNPYPQTGGTDWTFINPKPQNEDFFEFKTTFWKNMINVRNRQQSSDGKTSGYPTLQSIFWKYITMYQDVGIENNNFNYTNMMSYINSIGTYWIRLVEQMVPATTIWNTGTRFENSIFHRQKFIYRPQRGCLPVLSEVIGPQIGSGLAQNNCNATDVEISLLYDANQIIASFGNVINSISCGTGLAIIESLKYGFTIRVTKQNVTTDFVYVNPEVYTYPYHLITSTQWDDFVNQGLAYLSNELQQIGVSSSYNNTTNLLTLQSQDCVQIESIEFDLDYINIQPICP